MLVGFAASSPAEKAGSFTLRQAPRILYKLVQCNNSDDLNSLPLLETYMETDHCFDFLGA
jgi:hypothetical protein